MAEQPAQLTAEAGAVTLDGSQPESQVQVFTRSGKQVLCEIATLDVSATSGDETLTASPVYEECVMLGVGPATVKVNGCDLAQPDKRRQQILGVSTRTVGSVLLCGSAVHTTGQLVGTGHIKANAGGKPAGITLSTKS